MTVVQTFSVAIINPLHSTITLLTYVSSSACPHKSIHSVDASLLVLDHSKSHNLFAAVRYVDILTVDI